MKKVKSELQVLMFIPNIIGYIRVVFLVIAWSKWENPSQFLAFFFVSAILDMFDGAAARYFQQKSEFGAWFDIVIDNFSRGMIWSRLYPEWGNFVAGIEWLTFVCTHNLGTKWKDAAFVYEQPSIVKKIMSNGFYSPVGFLTISGMWLLPVWLYLKKMLQLPTVISGHRVDFLYLMLTMILCCGRLLALIAELWYILMHIRVLISHSILGDELEEEDKAKDT